MKKHRPAASAFVVFLLLFCGSVTAQETESKKRKALRITGKAAVFLAKTTAKAAFETAKFAGKYIVSPAFKNVAVPLAKAAPRVAKTTVKLAVSGVRKGIDAVTDNDDPGTDDRTTKSSKEDNTSNE